MYRWFGFWVIGYGRKISNAVQGVDLKFPADDEMLRGCYGNRPSCLAKDLPSEVGLTMKNRWKQKTKKLIYQGSFFRWWPALTLRCSLINVQNHDLSSLCNALLIEITFSFYQISYMMDRAGELKEFIWRWVCHIFAIARWETIITKHDHRWAGMTETIGQMVEEGEL